MRVAILDDIHDAYEQTDGVRRLRDRIGSTNLEIFTRPFGPPHALAGFDAVIANRERTRFSRDLLEQLPELKIIAQQGITLITSTLQRRNSEALLWARRAAAFVLVPGSWPSGSPSQ